MAAEYAPKPARAARTIIAAQHLGARAKKSTERLCNPFTAAKRCNPWQDLVLWHPDLGSRHNQICASVDLLYAYRPTNAATH